MAFEIVLNRDFLTRFPIRRPIKNAGSPPFVAMDSRTKGPLSFPLKGVGTRGPQLLPKGISNRESQ